jgi:hypothetical protein
MAVPFSGKEAEFKPIGETGSDALAAASNAPHRFNRPMKVKSSPDDHPPDSVCFSYRGSGGFEWHLVPEADSLRATIPGINPIVACII